MDGDYGKYPEGNDGDWSYDPEEIETAQTDEEPEPFEMPF